MENDKPGAGGLGDSLRRLSGSLLEGLQLRLDLALVEVQEEKQRLFVLLAGLLLVAGSAFMAFLCLNLLLIASFWDHRISLALGLSVFYALTAAVAGWAVVRWFRSSPGPFAATLEEIRKDRVYLTPDR